MTELALFGSTFILVFALGLQSLNVNNGHRIAAMFTSFLAAFLAGGPFGIYAAMAAHPYLVSIFKRAPSTTKETS